MQEPTTAAVFAQIKPLNSLRTSGTKSRAFHIGFRKQSKDSPYWISDKHSGRGTIFLENALILSYKLSPYQCLIVIYLTVKVS